MKSLNNYIETQYFNEHFINAVRDTSKCREICEKYGKQIWEMLNKCYAYIGGLLGAKTYEDFVKNYAKDEDIKMWKLVRRNGDHITACKIYKDDKGGRKSVAGGYDGTAQGKKDYLRIMHEDATLSDRQTWAEVSGKAFGSALKSNNCLIYPSFVAQVLMPNKEIKPKEDGFFYSRKIKGNWHTKIIIGYPPNGENKGVHPSEEEAKKFKELGKKYADWDTEENAKTDNIDT